MKTQISRDSFLPEQRYSGVYLQQGRMILDADWNELTDIQKAQLVNALRDAISGTNVTGQTIAGGAPRTSGLKLYADPAGSATIRIKPGALYVEGVPATLNAAAPMAVNAQADYPIPVSAYSGQNLRLYADVWERSVCALEQSALMDAAMHGADTASRSQTMLQVKWCANSVSPMDGAKNPAIGNAPLNLKLRLVGSSGDACDPCASQVRVNERLGNYLFRVEVHDYDATARVLTLKWSRDNGAEACEVENMPEGFSQGDWIWEYFDTDTERLLGNHLASGIDLKKLRGKISETCATPSDDYPNTYVRQWDGYIKINLDSGALDEGRDHGVDLDTGSVGSQAHGRVNLTSGVLKINLELMELELATTLTSGNASFVPGDYWLAPVREAVDESGDIVLNGELPRGVRHHYLFLGELAADGKLVAQDDAFSRRMNFPALTDIRAADVGFTDNCAKLYSGAKNVQQALDNLCAISAEDIAYPLPNCASNEGKSIKSRLFTINPTTVGAVLDKLLCVLNATSLPYTVPACAATPSVRSLLGLTADVSSNVAPILDKLLCELNATSLPYTVPSCPSNPNVFTLLGLGAADDNIASVLNKLLCGFNANDMPLDKSDTGLCSDLQVDAAVTVQDALKILCNKSGGGCAVTVSSSEQLELLLKEFAAGDAMDLWLCLKAGSYPIEADLVIAGKRSLRIGGQGAESTSIGFSGNTLSVQADEVILENFAVNFSSTSGQLAIAADASQTRGCHFSRTSRSSDAVAMLSVDSRSGGVCHMAWHDNTLLAQVKKETGNAAKWAGETVIGDARVSKAVLALSDPSVVFNPKSYQAALSEATKEVMNMSYARRAEWGTKLGGVQDDTLAIARITKTDTQAVSDALKSSGVNATDIMRALDSMASFWIQITPDYALRLEHYKVGGTLEGNKIDGYLLFGNGIDGYSSPAANSIKQLRKSPVVSSSGENIHLLSNSITAIKANLSTANSDGYMDEAIQANARLVLSNNRIEDTENAISAKNIVASGNYWAGGTSDLGYFIADRASLTGNIVEDDANKSKLICTLAETQLIASGNLLLQVFPMLV